MSQLYLGLDMGTSGARGVVIDATGTSVGNAQSALHQHGDNHRAPAIWWAAVESVLHQLGQQLDMSAVTALSVDATSGTVLAMDADEKPTGDALMYNDAVSDQSILEAIAAHAPDTSAVHGASSALARSISLQRRNASCRIVHQADWIVGNLCGRYDVSDESNALKTGYDPVARKWPDWLPKTGVDLARLPAIVPTGSIIGTVDDRTCSAFGFSNATQVVAGMSDGCASFLATGADEIGDCVTALGSTITMKMLSDRPLFNPEYGIYSHRIGDYWLAGGASNSGGQVLAHYFETKTLIELSDGIDAELDSGLHYYPLLKPGERFPHNDADWQPVLTPRPANDREFLHGMLEGMAGIERTGYQRLRELGAPAIRSMRTVGGGAKNPAWTRLRERALGLSFSQSLSTQAAMGMARFALASSRANR